MDGSVRDRTDGLVAELEQRASALLAVNAIADVVLRVADACDGLDRVLEVLAQRTRFPAIALFQTNEAAQRLELLCSRGFAEASRLAATSLPVNGSITGAAVRGREIVASPDLGVDPRVPAEVRERLLEEGFVGAVSVPLLAGDRALGAMNLLYKSRDVPNAEIEREMLKSIGRTIALAMERARYLRRLQQERQRSDATLRSIGDGVIVTDARGNVTLMNASAERITGWSEKEAFERPLEEIFRIYDEKTRSALASPIARSLETGEVVRIEEGVVLTARDGTERDVVDTSAPILSPGGRLEGVVLGFQDVTRKLRDHNWLAFMHEASLLLARSLDYETTLTRVTRLAVGLADVCLVDIVQPDGSIHRLAGAHRDPEQQSLVDNVVKHSQLDPEALEGVTRAVRTLRPVLYDFPSEERREGIAAHGAYFEALDALGLGSGLVVPLIVDGPRAIGAIVLASRGFHRFDGCDVERASQLAHCFALAIQNASLHRQVQDSLAMREEFLNLLSHELKTPMTALQLHLAIFERGLPAPTDPATAERLARTKEQLRRLVTLTDDLLNVSRFSTEPVALHPETVDLRQIVADAMDRCREEANRAGCTFQVRAGSALAWRCDPQLMRVAISNLLANAVKFGRGDPIEISVESNGDAKARILVTDHETGLRPRTWTGSSSRSNAPSRRGTTGDWGSGFTWPGRSSKCTGVRSWSPTSTTGHDVYGAALLRQWGVRTSLLAARRLQLAHDDREGKGGADCRRIGAWSGKLRGASGRGNAVGDARRDSVLFATVTESTSPVGVSVMRMINRPAGFDLEPGSFS